MKSNLALVTSATCGGQGIQFIHVCDRGADNFDVFAHLLLKGDSWVIRAAQLKRRLCTASLHWVLYTHESVASFLKSTSDAPPDAGTGSFIHCRDRRVMCTVAIAGCERNDRIAAIEFLVTF